MTTPATFSTIPAGVCRRRVHISYHCCTVCGRTPAGHEEPNDAPIRFWDEDDGWKTGTLCRWCAAAVIGKTPHPDHYAYRHQGHHDDSGTDEVAPLSVAGA